MIKHITEWLLLVLPGIAITAGVAWVALGWFVRSFWHFLGAWLGGLLFIGLATSGIVWLISQFMDGQLSQCNESAEYYLCTNHMHMIGYPIVISLIAFGIYLICPLVWGISRLFVRARNKRVSA